MTHLARPRKEGDIHARPLLDACKANRVEPAHGVELECVGAPEVCAPMQVQGQPCDACFARQIQRRCALCGG